MIQSFSPDQQKAASVGGSQYINKTGAYTGVISQASVKQNANGATFIDIVFKGDDGGLAFIQSCIIANNGNRTFQHDIFDALLIVLGVENAPVVQGKVYDRKGVPSDGYRIPSIEKKHVGLFLQREQRFYIDKNDGMEKESYQMNLLTPFNVQTRQIARELLTNREAKRLDQMIETVKDRAGKRIIKERLVSGYESATAETLDDNMPF